jgi:UDP-N-acetylglucosamine 3-dehydrogenase
MGALHAKVISSLSNAELVAVQDIDEKRAKSLAERFHVDYYSNYDHLLNRKDIDAVVIATPDHLHKDPTVAAAEAGKHILLEKPIATNVVDAQAIINVCKKTNIKLMIAHILRFDPRYYAIKSAIEEGTIGKPILFYARRNAPIIEARRLRGRVPVLFYLAIHDIDLILWYMNGQVKTVFSQNVEEKVKEELGVPDFSVTVIRFENGAVATVECGWGLTENWAKWEKPKSWGGFGDVRMDVVGTEGSIYLNYYPMCLYACDKEGWKFPDTLHWPTLYNDKVGDILHEDSQFISCIINDKKPLVNGEDGLNALKVVLAAEKSAKTSKPENISSF